MILPMNAKTLPADKVAKVLADPSYIAEVKIDGYRAIFENSGFHSRLGNTFDLPQITRWLKDYDVILDGELYIHRATSSDITTALGKDGDKGKLRYVVFDVLGTGGDTLLTGMPWNYRRELLERIYDDIDPQSPIDLSKVYPDKLGLRSFDEAMDYIESHGIEGLMLKNTQAIYEPDSRHVNNWWKLKKHMTYDVVIMGYEEGKGKFKGLIGSIVFGLYKGDVLTSCGKCSGMTDELRREISENREAFETMVFEIKAMERTKDGAFRHPVFSRFRTDKTPWQCLWEQ
jgi:ATP-dependent DNA ligase